MKSKKNNIAGILDFACAVSLMLILLVSLNIAIFYVPGRGQFAFPTVMISQNTVNIVDGTVAYARGSFLAVGDALISAVQHSTVLGG